MDPQNRLSISFRVMHPRVVTRRFAVSQHRSVEEVLGDGPIARVKLDRAIMGINPAAAPVSVPLCEEEQEEYCQSSTEWPPAS